jgi:hypothetical protein
MRRVGWVRRIGRHRRGGRGTRSMTFPIMIPFRPVIDVATKCRCFAYHLHRLQERPAQSGQFARRSKTVLPATIVTIIVVTGGFSHGSEGFGRLPQRVVQISTGPHGSAHRSKAPALPGRRRYGTPARAAAADQTWAGASVGLHNVPPTRSQMAVAAQAATQILAGSNRTGADKWIQRRSKPRANSPALDTAVGS